MASRGVKVSVDVSGPLFQRDPSLTVKGNIRRMMQGIAEEGERAIRDAIGTLNLRRSTGWTKDHVRGRITSYAGRKWTLNAVVSANTSGLDRTDAIRTLAAAASVESRYHPFRRVANQLKSSRAVLGANLTEGLE